MKFALPLIALMLVAAAGCQDKKNPATTPWAAAPDLTPTPIASSATVTPVAYTPAPTDPAAVSPIDTATPNYSNVNLPANPSAAGGKYTVKPGDTLYRIAVNHYGDGKQWKKIADANPGLTPAHLRVGQTITLP